MYVCMLKICMCVTQMALHGSNNFAPSVP
jgi:hypothetical protein